MTDPQRTQGIAGSGWLRLYPRAWRERYEAELLAVLESRPATGRARLDLVRGALDAHLHPLGPPMPPVIAAVIAGGAWIVAGTTSAVQPLIPDWPGYLLETLPVGVLGAVAALRATTMLGLRSGLAAPPTTPPAVLSAVIGHLAWIAALAIAAVGGPYGAVTGATASVAAVGTVLVGLARLRADDHPVGEGLVLVGGALLIPSPVAWVVAGVAWLGIAVAILRPVRPPRPV